MSTEQEFLSQTAKNKYNTPALEKGLDIIEALSESDAGFTLNQLAKHLNKNVSQIFRMVVTLAERGYIQCDDNDRYTLTLKLFELANKQPPLKRLIQKALPFMKELADTARQSSHLTVYQNGRVIVIAQIENPERWSFGVKVGAVIGLTDTSSGHVLMAFHDESKQQQMLEMHSTVHGEPEVTFDKLKEKLQEVKKLGFSRMPSKQVQGIINIAFPIYSEQNKVIAAINVPFLPRIDNAPGPDVEMVTRIEAAIGERLSRELGYRGDYLFVTEAH